MFENTRLLVANRGEIAIRIAATARAMGIATVAVYTDLDAGSPHVEFCDAALQVPSYLDIDAIVAGAVKAEVTAIHPGYGFLSERAPFAQAVVDAGLEFVGPNADVIEQMGRKDAAREIAVAAGVPVVPSYGLHDDPAGFAYPILIKAAAGGGGKGMRVVRSVEEYDEGLRAARSEASRSFGDDAVLIEKYVERGRHLEVQVLADAHGTVLHLGTRDCSAQRRHQKVIEEAPAPDLPGSVREQIQDAAVALARQVGYVNAGTVEFLLDVDTGEAYFLEMNTRLQVEHPVTEMVVRVEGEPIDLVEWQLRIAAGEPLPFGQDDVEFVGHAMEARIYAEDAFGGFLPQAGTATYVAWPSTDDVPGVRVDHALESGLEVSTAYDPMLGKVIVHGLSREDARERLIGALDATAILGLTTNTGYLRQLAASPEFAALTIDTAWLDHHELAPPDDELARAAVAVTRQRITAATSGPWHADGFRATADPAPLRIWGETFPAPGGHWYSTRSDDGPVALADDTGRRAWVAHGEDEIEVVAHGQRTVFTRPATFGDPTAATGDGSVLAPMPGTVLDIRVAAGDHVEVGDVLGVMEAMKMELALKAPFAGIVTGVDAAVGDQVKLGAVLFEVEAQS